MIDSHCHLDLETFEQDLDLVMRQAIDQGVSRFLVPGTALQGWPRQCALARQYPEIDIALGMHPWFISPDQENTTLSVERLLADAPSALVAMGEMGLDAAIDISLAQQVALFEQQLCIARDASLPVIIHHHKSHHLILQSIKRTTFRNGGVIHAFSGSREVAEHYLAAGFLLGIGGVITYPRAQKTRETVKHLPLTSLLLETDSPSMPVCGRQGLRNEPAVLPSIASALADLQQASIEHICQQTTQNYFRCFKHR